MAAPEDDLPLPPQALFLKRLVLSLTVVMIAGFLVLIATLVVRLNQTPAAAPLPETITLPEGARALAFTQGPDWLAVVTDDGRVLVYDRDGAGPRQILLID